MLPEFEWDENFEFFLNQLPTKAAAKLLAMIESIEHYGIQTAIQQQWVKKIDSNLYEIRTSHNGIYLRGCYFQVHKQKYFITHGFLKKTNKTPEREKERSRKIRKIYFKIKGKEE